MVITCYCITSQMNVVYHISNMYYIPSGKLTYTSITMENHPFWMGKLTINGHFP